MTALLPLALLLALAPPTRWVTDEAGALTPAVRSALDARLEAYQASTGHQVIVYVGRTTSGEPVEDWAARTFQAWKLGRKGLDDGAALFVFTEDHAARIEVGYGLEGVLTDAKSSRILRERLIPRMRANDPGGAVAGAVEGMLEVLGGGGGAAPPAAPVVPESARLIAYAVMALLFIILAIWKPRLAFFLLMMMTGRRRGGGGGGFSGGGFSGGGGRSGGGGATGHW